MASGSSTNKGDAPYPIHFVGAHGRGLKRLGLMLDKTAGDGDDVALQPEACAIAAEEAGFEDGGPALPEERAGVGRQESGDDLHEGRFAGPVFAQQQVDLARVDLKRTVAQRVDAGEALLDGLRGWDHKMQAVGVIALSLGIGFVISAIMSYGVSRRLGLIDSFKSASQSESSVL